MAGPALPAAGAPMAPSDHDLIARVADRDRGAFADLYDRYAPRAFGLILKIVRNRTDAEDVLQDAFLQVWNQVGRYDPARASPEVWVLLLARSRAVDRIRRRTDAPTEAVGADVPAAPEDPGLELQRAEDTGRLQTALDSLPPEQRELIRLSFFHGLTHQEIACRQSLPLGTVKTRIRLGLLRLRDRFAAEGAVP